MSVNAAYNKMMSTTNSLTSVTEVGGDDSQPLAAALVGDASVRSVLNEVLTTQSVAKGDALRPRRTQALARAEMKGTAQNGRPKGRPFVVGY